MLEVKATDITHLDARYTRNEIVEIVDSVDVDNPDRAGLTYHLELSAPDGWQSPNYEVIATLSGHEKPAVNFGGALQYEGWTAYIEEYLDARVSWPMPTVPIKGVEVSTLVVTPYKVKSWAERNGNPVEGSLKESGIQYAIKGKLGEMELPSYPDFLSAYRDEKMQWLTRKPSAMKTGRNTPEVLSYLVNAEPRPTVINVRVSVNYFDGTNERFTFQTVAGPVMWSILNISTGFLAMDLPAREIYRLENEDPADKALNWHRIHNYDVYLTDQAGRIIAAPRKYIVDTDTYKEEAVLLINNTLGGVDTVRFTGAKEQSIVTNAELAGRPADVNPSITGKDLYVVNHTAERKLTINTGLISDRHLLQWLEEVGWAEEIILIYDQSKNGIFRYTIPLNLAKADFLEKDAEGLGVRSFEFTPARKAISVNNLPERLAASVRPTAWIPQGSYCLVNERGMRTGYLGAGKLKLFYTDIEPYQAVKGVSMKDNREGTDGYIPPVLSSSCEAGTAPAYNEPINKMGSYKKQGCAAGYTGIETMISVPAAIFGGVTVAEANKLALAEWNRRNTQTAANANVSGCVLAPENYTDVTPGAGKAWFRFNTTSSPGAYSNHAVDKQQGEEFKGNAWWCWGKSSSDVYAPGTNNIQLPVLFGPGNSWGFTVYGRADGVRQYAAVYVNGVAAVSGDGTDVFSLFVPHGDIQEGDRVYVKIWTL